MAAHSMNREICEIRERTPFVGEDMTEKLGDRKIEAILHAILEARNETNSKSEVEHAKWRHIH
jgi:hypothetical protein